MRVLMLHNFYRRPGGEDSCFFAESEMLKRQGDAVATLEVHNDDTLRHSASGLAVRTIWNSDSYRAVADRIREFRPDVMHCHNIFPLLSPSVYYAASRAGVPVVQTLHNYRLLCLAATLFRDGSVCELCLGRLPWRGIAGRCYHDSFAHSVSVASLLVAHRALRTWRKKVDLFVAVSNFTRNKYVEAGFDPDALIVKPNTVAVDPGIGDGAGGFALLVGRLVPEKGLATVLKAWRATSARPQLVIVGDGPFRTVLDGLPEDGSILFLGQLPAQEVYGLMQRASFLIAASEWYETFGMTIIEAFACGTPVIAARIGAYTELVEHGVTGMLFEPGDAGGIEEAVSELCGKPLLLRSMRDAARQKFDACFSEAVSYRALIATYEAAQQRRQLSKSEADRR